jgi:hypothetical protein
MVPLSIPVCDLWVDIHGQQGEGILYTCVELSDANSKTNFKKGEHGAERY